MSDDQESNPNTEPMSGEGAPPTTAPREAGAEEARGVDVFNHSRAAETRGVDVFDRNPDLEARGVDVFDRSRETETRGVDVFDQGPAED